MGKNELEPSTHSNVKWIMVLNSQLKLSDIDWPTSGFRPRSSSQAVPGRTATTHRSTVNWGTSG